jgi:hypothetical protein
LQEDASCRNVFETDNICEIYAEKKRVKAKRKKSIAEEKIREKEEREINNTKMK